MRKNETGQNPIIVNCEEIFNFINKADTFVLCWSENAAQSEYVEKERKAALELAYPNRKPRDLAPISIKPYNIPPYATPPEDMIENYHFEELKDEIEINNYGTKNI